MKTKILLIVEGDVEEVRILGNHAHGLLKLIDADYEIVTFANPIYELYEAYKNGEYDDIVTYLRHFKGLNIENDKLSKNLFSAIYLIFDFEPHYHKYSDEDIIDILSVFSNETENGKIYINYPMVEAFYHLKDLPDEEYVNRVVRLPLKNGKEYKKLVNSETAIQKNRMTDKVLELIILQNFEKAKKIAECCNSEIDYEQLLKNQLKFKNCNNQLYVLSTFPLLIIDYNPDILTSIKKNVEEIYKYKISD